MGMRSGVANHRCFIVRDGFRSGAASGRGGNFVKDAGRNREITSVSSPSPDGGRVVIGVSRSNVETNAREVSWVIVPLKGSSKPVTLTAGKEIYEPGTAGGSLNVRAQWSGDGHWFFYLRREGEEVQLWKTDWKGENTQQVTHSNADLIGLSASTDPNELLVQLAPQRDVLRKAEEEEDRAGILYDDHVMPGYPLSKTLPVIDRWRNVRRTDDGKYVPPGWGTRSAVFNIRTRELKVNSESEVGRCQRRCGRKARGMQRQLHRKSTLARDGGEVAGHQVR